MFEVGVSCVNNNKKMNLGKLEPEELDAITGEGMNLDIDIAKISSCPYHSIRECEENCIKYSGCHTIAYAGDILVTYTGEDS